MTNMQTTVGCTLAVSETVSVASLTSCTGWLAAFLAVFDISCIPYSKIYTRVSVLATALEIVMKWLAGQG